MKNRLLTDGLVPFLAVSEADMSQLTNLGVQVGIALLAMLVGRVMDRVGKKVGIRKIEVNVIKAENEN